MTGRQAGRQAPAISNPLDKSKRQTGRQAGRQTSTCDVKSFGLVLSRDVEAIYFNAAVTLSASATIL